MRNIIKSIENKRKFFSLYWGTKVLKHNFWFPSEPPSLIGNREAKLFSDAEKAKEIETHHLLLTPLSQITDEDLLHIYHLSNALIGYDSTMDFKPFIVMAKRLWCLEGDKFLYKYAPCADYLRSKGYALPWMGIPVETQVEWGWAKLKTV